MGCFDFRLVWFGFGFVLVGLVTTQEGLEGFGREFSWPPPSCGTSELKIYPGIFRIFDHMVGLGLAWFDFVSFWVWLGMDTVWFGLVWFGLVWLGWV